MRCRPIAIVLASLLATSPACVSTQHTHDTSARAGEDKSSDDDLETASEAAGSSPTAEDDAQNPSDRSSKFSISHGSIKSAGYGKLDADTIEAVVGRNQADLQVCAATVADNDAFSAGQVVVNLHIDRGGSVKDANFTKDTIGSGMGKCVANTVKKWRFPKPKGGEVMVNVTFEIEES